MGRFFWPSCFLLLLLLSAGLVSEFFKNPHTKDDGRPYNNPFRHAFLEGITQIHITNRLGELIISREGSEGDKWMLTHPKEIEAGSTVIQHLLDSLKNIKIRKVYQKDQIHMANFSLDNPIFTVKLTNPQLGTHSLKMGVINPIDESTYILLGNDSQIYQIDSFRYPIETYTFSEFIEARVVPLDILKIRKLIFSFGGGDKVSFIKNENSWFNEKQIPLNGGKVRQFLKDLTTFKGQMILDKKLQIGNKTLTNYLSSNLHLLDITDVEGKNYHYEISRAIAEGVSELKINANESVVVRASNKEHLYIVDKDFLELLKIEGKEFLSFR